MFAQLPKLFDRSFFIGFVLPASLMFLGVIGSLVAFDYIKPGVVSNKATFDAALSVVIVWFISILLMALNRPVIRLLEGYGDYNPLKIFLSRRKKEFTDRIFPLFTTFEQIIEARRNKEIEPDQEFNFSIKLWNAVNEYPEQLDLVLSTKLGNVMRAYERYSDVVYGMEAVVLWPRLLMVIPDEARTRVREAEAMFYFSLNTLIAGTLSVLFYLVLSTVYLQSFGASRLSDVVRWPFIPVISALSAWFGWWQLPNAARQRGEQIKAVFDLYRGELAEALGLEIPATHKAEQEMWNYVSRRMLWRVSADVKSLDEFRKRNGEQPSDELAKGPQASQKDETMTT
jgi:hypothetical protein